MSVDLSIIGKHSIPFNNRELKNKLSLLELLNSLELEKSNFLKEMCITWNTSYIHHKSEASKREKEELERCLKINSWKIEFEETDNCWSDSINYELEGPYGLKLELNKYYFEVSIWIGRYYQWFVKEEDYHSAWREKWRLIIHKITTILGGDYVLYFPDNMSDLSSYWPRNFFFPNDMGEYLKANINNLDQAVEAISKTYTEPITLSQADKIFERNNKDPFVVDKFEDLDKTLEI